MSQTKIVILQMKEIIYTAIFIGLGLLLVLLLLLMFHPGKEKDSTPPLSTNEPLYTPGIYTTELTLGNHTVNLEVLLDSDHVSGIQLTTLDESVTTMYPLLEPVVEDISTQLSSGVTLDNVVLSTESQYTQMLILQAVDETLEKAAFQ